jgi:hypothetical protein
MAGGSRSRASRAERRMQKERAASALQRGLPVPTPLPKRGLGSAAHRGSSASHPPGQLRSSSIASTASRRMPLSVKFLGVGFGLLVLVYGLRLFRDRESVPNPVATPLNTQLSGSGAK